MIKKDVIINIKESAKPETLAGIVAAASRFQSKIHINCKGKQVNAKSIMGMMMLGFFYGEEITVSADGSDEIVALEAMVEILG